MMLRRPAHAIAVLSLCCALVTAAPNKKKPRRTLPGSPRVSATARAAALRKVDGYLDRSTPGSFSQPGALVPFFEQLYRLSEAVPEAPPVHILHFGDSHTAADELTGRLRDLLKQRFGDGGSGFSLAGKPFLGYRRYDARGGATPLWHSEGFRSATGDGYFGLGGFSITADRAGQSVYLDTECDHLEVHYLRQPGGGNLVVSDGDDPIDRISTDGELGPDATRYDISPGRHHFQARSAGSGPVRLFGWVADRNTGITYEALGINGAEASVMLRWNQPMVATYLQRRSPGLIVLAYGTNEASDPKWSEESYQQTLSELLRNLRAAAPAASILLLGPADRMSRQQGAWRPLSGIDRVIAGQQNACRENRCAYWDTCERMGGRGAMRDWVYAGLAQGDYVHFTSSGYHRLADMLFEDLMRQYESYKKTRHELQGQSGNGHAN